MAVVLAAGGGTRLRPLTRSRPKCLLEVGGRPLLDYLLGALAAHGVHDVLVVVGHHAEQVACRYAGRVRALLNPDYETTNNLHSLWVARREFAGRDFLCLHADLLFHPAILGPCLAAENDVTVVLDRTPVDETLKVRVAGGQVVEISKNIPADKVFGTFLGIARFSARASAMLPAILDSLVVEESNRQRYFTRCLQGLTERGCAAGYTLTEGYPWIEIDVAEDLERAGALILPRLPVTRENARENPARNQ
ncbi:MAG: NTP transferase domain-containing protein [Terriglobia bacterium]